ncbi:UPF0389 protein GA21628-like [Haliotis cracherodii]|uniref:UPF0389 protein GA21628-like n=1 Tax=Haliotis cracherodii TaxID=6455 RepID=UPI0039EB4C3B
MAFCSPYRRWAYDLLQLVGSRCYKATDKSIVLNSQGLMNRSPICQNQGRSFCENAKPTGRPEPVGRTHRPSNFDKKILVLQKVYPSVEAVPKEISHSQILKSRDWLRIRVNLGMGVATIMACFLMIYVGKREAKQGKSISRQSLEWQKKLREEGEEKKT